MTCVRFRVLSIIRDAQYGPHPVLTTVRMHPVGPKVWRYGGVLELMTSDPEAVSGLQLGREYDVTISPADPAAEPKRKQKRCG
jgi:hypothetical protein